MNVIVFVFVMGSVLSGTGTVSGRVLNVEGSVVPAAQVWLEPSIGSALLSTRSEQDGTFRFAGLSPGLVGVFAVAEGCAFGGASVNVPAGEDVADVTIRLGAPDSIEGKVVDFRGKAVEGAHITRVAVLGETKVGIPLGKMESEGIEEPVTGKDGKFVISRLPKGARVALKVTHSDFAQEGVADVAVGAANVRVSLFPGVVVQGRVYAEDGQTPVANVVVVIKNARPPYDTSLALTDSSGAFVVRLKPGDYMYQAAASLQSSPGWRELLVSADQPEQRVALYVVGIGGIRGEVRDAVTGKPIAGAKLILYANGNRADVMRTGSAGVFEATTTEGQNEIALESVPGYMPSDGRSLKVNVVEGEVSVLPTFWVAPIPACTVQIVDADMRPVPGTIVTVLRPAQLGWRVTDDEGKVELRFASLPAEGSVVAMAEHLTKPLGALFRVTPGADGPAVAQLVGLATVRGTVATAKGNALEGAVVGAFFADEATDEGIPYWRTISRQGGVFEWQSALPAPQVCVATGGAQTTGKSASFLPSADGVADVGAVVVANGLKTASLYGKTLRWRKGAQCCGPPLDATTLSSTPAVIIYCDPAAAATVIESTTEARRLLTGTVLFAVVVDGVPACANTDIPVFSGKAPGPATTYVVAADGTVALETFGLPPVRVLQQLIVRTGS